VSSGAIFRAASTARALRSRASSRWAFIGAVGAAAFLLARLAPDVHGKPLFEDEAVSGLIGARPPWEILVTTLWDRGGAPLHFLLVHVAFVFDASPSPLRWLSVVFALATVGLCYDLGWRLEGRVAGVTAAVVAACSGMLAVYGSFGRMYALLAFAAALAADLFVRALDLRTTGAVAAAAGAAWLLPAVHPYGGIVVAVEAVVALALWRGRPLRPAIPVVAIGLALIPFLVADLRLANRFEVSSGSTHRLATRDEAWNQLTDALRGFAGGSGWTLVVFVVLGIAGAVLLARRRTPFVAWGVAAFVLPPLLATLAHTGRAPDLSPRHLIFALPFWAAFVGAAVARIPFGVLAVAAVAALAAISPPGIHDPRSITYTAALGSEERVAAPARYLKRHVRDGDVLYPYSSVFLAALPEAGRAHGLPRGQVQSLVAAAKRIDYPVRELFVAIPSGDEFPFGNFGVIGEQVFPSWILVRRLGPFPNEVALLQDIHASLEPARAALLPTAPRPLAGWFDLNMDVICKSLRELGSECVSE
jgi:Dolichyl-phosphate-mannose-protein mannosyltransferase